MKNEIDYICVRRRLRSALKDMRTFRGAEVDSNHYLMIGTVKLKLKRQQRENAAWPYRVEKLKDQSVARYSRSTSVTDSKCCEMLKTLRNSGMYSRTPYKQLQKIPLEREEVSKRNAASRSG